MFDNRAEAGRGVQEDKNRGIKSETECKRLRLGNEVGSRMLEN